MTGPGVNPDQNPNPKPSISPNLTQNHVQKQHSAVAPRTISILSVRVNKLLYFILSIVEVLLGFRFVFKLLGANPASGFVALLYSMTDTLLAPFSGVFGVSAARRSVIEWSIFVAMIVYWVLAIGVMQLVNILFSASSKE